jgi:hypothetical protein
MISGGNFSTRENEPPSTGSWLGPISTSPSPSTLFVFGAPPVSTGDTVTGVGDTGRVTALGRGESWGVRVNLFSIERKKCTHNR